MYCIHAASCRMFEFLLLVASMNIHYTSAAVGYIAIYLNLFWNRSTIIGHFKSEILSINFVGEIQFQVLDARSLYQQNQAVYIPPLN